ncbi:hypothetical protein EAE32_05205 [Kocuria tytonicola]|uniref:General stress protein 17M-like domain-containing protein n=1 Tax=Kocuria tytonicola TaxID=2055946 RepID=A0A3L9L6X5_9MICC|nr:general stress protein [Kocuria tytonicola]RLY94570.1 hypothetical protein EAE32_05205 [Kocuria tytonicola]
MSNPNRSPAQLSIAPEMPRGEVVGRYRTYAEAQKAVDYMSDEHFPVAMVSIIGSDLKSVEQVTGRLSYPRVALQGALNGIFFGAFFGLVMTMFGGANMVPTVLLTMLLGGAFFMLMATITYAMSRGKRDFTSTSRIVAGSYEVLAAPEVAGQARQVLGGMPGEPGAGARAQNPAPFGGRGPGGARQDGGNGEQWGPGGPGHGGARQGAPHGGAPRNGTYTGGPEGRPGVPGQGTPSGAAHGSSSAASAPGASQDTQPGPAAQQQDPNRSAKFPDLPDGRPQYGIRVEAEATPEVDRSAPWTRTGGPAAAQDARDARDAQQGGGAENGTPENRR